MAYERRQHGGGAVPTTLSSSITSGATTIALAAATGWPDGVTGKFYVVIDPGGTGEEKVLATATSGTNLTSVTRGVDGTSAAAHAAGVVVEHTFSAIEADEANKLVNATYGTLTTKGDLLPATGAGAFARLAAGANDLPLIADSAQTTGLKYAALPVAGGGTASTTAVAARTALGLAIGTNVQAWDTDLDALAGVTYAADTISYFTGAHAAAVTTLSTFGRTLIDDADAATARATLGSVIGTNVQAWSANLDAYDPLAVPKGCLGRTIKTSNVTGLTSSAATLTGMTVTVTVAASRRIKVSARTWFSSTVAGDDYVMAIKEGSTQLGIGETAGSRIGENYTVTSEVILDAPSAGSHTYFCVGGRAAGSGTVTMAADATSPAFIMVEDIGPG